MLERRQTEDECTVASFQNRSELPRIHRRRERNRRTDRRCTRQLFRKLTTTVVDNTVQGQSDNKRALKKFFYRLKENIGLAERTEFSKTLSDAFDDLDKYKVSAQKSYVTPALPWNYMSLQLCLDRLSESVCTVIQGNSAFRKMVSS